MSGGVSITATSKPFPRWTVWLYERQGPPHNAEASTVGAMPPPVLTKVWPPKALTRRYFCLKNIPAVEAVQVDDNYPLAPYFLVDVTVTPKGQRG